jgi:hypothetical protein
MCDKPVINIAYGAHFSETGQDLTPLLYQMHHYQNVLKSGGVEVVHSEAELTAAISRALREPGLGAAGRAKLRSYYCANSDGHAAERIADLILSMKKR